MRRLSDDDDDEDDADDVDEMRLAAAADDDDEDDAPVVWFLRVHAPQQGHDAFCHRPAGSILRTPHEVVGFMGDLFGRPPLAVRLEG